MRCYLFDIDGTIADLTHRLHHIQKQPKDWDAFYAACIDDAPINHIRTLMDDLHQYWTKFVYVSGRSDQVRKQTEEWLERHSFPSGPLYMRKAGDHRPDHLVKLELLDQLTADGYKPTMAFDDRNQVVEMWRQKGIPCAQVAEGNF